jgi:23S rRNA (pseudouridine1915-N3)-methyltransferase
VKLSVVAVGRLRDPNHRALCDDYCARLVRLGSFSVVEVKDVRGLAPSQTPGAEGQRLLRQLPSSCHAVSLDERGRELTSEGLARWLQEHADSGTRDLRLVLGGPYGLADEVHGRCVESLRLSSMTLPHELARTVLLEQLYRAHMIMAGRPYHNS